MSDEPKYDVTGDGDVNLKDLVSLKKSAAYL
jgi:hypothetical protein